MSAHHPYRRRALHTILAVLAMLGTATPFAQAQDAARPMTFLDVREMRSVSAPTPSPDGQRMIYVLSTPDWQEAKSQTDIYLVSMHEGVDSTRQMTFTKTKNESSPRWASDGRAFFFLSNREAPSNAENRNQLYMMRPDGGEAQRLTEAEEGVRDYQISDDGRWLVYRSGKDRRGAAASSSPGRHRAWHGRTLTTHPTGIGTWRIAPDGDAHLLSLAGPRRHRREGAPREEVHRQHPPHGDIVGQPVGPRSR